MSVAGAPAAACAAVDFKLDAAIALVDLRLKAIKIIAIAVPDQSAFNTRSAPFSPIRIAAALVLAEVMVGITEASITRSPSRP